MLVTGAGFLHFLHLRLQTPTDDLSDNTIPTNLSPALEEIAEPLARLENEPVTVEIGQSGVTVDLHYLAWPTITKGENSTLYAAAIHSGIILNFRIDFGMIQVENTQHYISFCLEDFTMKKVVICWFVVFSLCFALVGCQSSQPKTTEPAATLETTVPAETTTSPETTAPATIISFEDISWTRDTCDCKETLRFNSDGSCSYSCACGNPVNDSDLCEGYTYDDATKTITLNCIETTDEMITTIKIVKCDENSLHLDFNGEIRIFEK